MEHIPLVPPQRGRRPLVRPVLLLTALSAALYFTATGQAILTAVKEAVVGVPEPTAPVAGDIVTSDPLAGKSDRDVADSKPLPAATSEGEIQAAVPVPDLPDPKKEAAEAARAAEEAASAAAAAEKAKDEAAFAAATAPSQQLRALSERVSPAGTGLSEYLAAQLAHPTPEGARPLPVPWAGASAQPVAGQAASPYAGLWEGAFSGRTDGELALYVQPDGRYRGTVAIDSRRRLFPVTGTVSSSGGLRPDANPLLGPLGLFELQGGFKLDAGTAHGYWSPGAHQAGGTWFIRKR